jgi:uncharacterized protein (DUF342 family)
MDDNISEYLKADSFSPEALIKAGFMRDQIDEIKAGLDEELDVSLYADNELYSLQMREIRLGLEEKVDVSLFADKKYDWFQMQEIRLGLAAGLNVDLYADPSIPYQKMRELRKGLEDDIDLSDCLDKPAGLIRQIRHARRSGIDISSYIDEGYDTGQLEEIIICLENNVDIKPYLSKDLRKESINEIRLGLEHGVPVDSYAGIRYNNRQMHEIRLGLEKRLDTGIYASPLFGYEQMREIRLGLESGIDVGEYASLMYTWTEMKHRRLALESMYQDDILEAPLSGMAEDTDGYEHADVPGNAYTLDNADVTDNADATDNAYTPENAGVTDNADATDNADVPDNEVNAKASFGEIYEEAPGMKSMADTAAAGAIGAHSDAHSGAHSDAHSNAHSDETPEEVAKRVAPQTTVDSIRERALKNAREKVKRSSIEKKSSKPLADLNSFKAENAANIKAENAANINAAAAGEISGPEVSEIGNTDLEAEAKAARDKALKAKAAFIKARQRVRRSAEEEDVVYDSRGNKISIKSVRDDEKNEKSYGSEYSKHLQESILNIKNISVSIDPDEMAAYMTFKDRRLHYSEAEMLMALKKAGVVKGIFVDVIERIARKGVSDNNVLIAKGSYLLNDLDGYYNMNFDPDAEKGDEDQEYVEQDKDASIDFNKLTLLKKVNAGDLLMTYVPMVKGHDGYTVTGRIFHRKRGHELPVVTGHGFTVSDDGRVYKASTNGRMEFDDHGLIIHNVREIHDDIDGPEKIEYDGELYIYGNVGDNVRIDATEKIVIVGHVDAACLTCGGDIVITEGMNGGNQGSVKSERSVYGKFFESCNIEVKKDLYADYIFNSRVSAAGHVSLRGEKGCVIGGTLSASKGLSVKVLGNKTEVRTSIKIGQNDEFLKELARLNRKLKIASSELESLKSAYRGFNKKFTPEQRKSMDMYVKIQDAIYTKTKEVDSIRADINEVNDEINGIKFAKVIIYGIINKGTEIDFYGKIFKGHAEKNIIIQRIAEAVRVRPIGEG